MAFSYDGERGNYGVKSIASTTPVNPSQSIAAGQLLVVVLVTDNVGISEGVTDNHSVADDQANSYTKLQEYTRTGGSPADGVTISLHISELDTGLGTGDTVTGSHASSLAHAIGLWEFSTAGSVTEEASNGTAGTGTSISTTLSSLTSRAYLLLHASGLEEKNNMSWTKDADYTAVATMIGSGTAGAGASNVSAQLEFRLATVTSDTCAPTAGVSCDWATAYAAVYEDVSGPVTVNLDTLASIGAAIDLSVVPGLATVSLDTLAGIGRTINLTVSTISEVLVTLNTLAGLGAPINLTVVPGLATVNLNTLAGIGAAIDLLVVPGLATVGLNTLAGIGASVGLSVVPGVATIGLNTLAGVGASVSLSVIPGPVTIGLNTLAGIGQAVTLTVGGIVIVGLNTLAGVGAAVGLSVVPGPVTIGLNTLAGIGATVQLVVGGAVVVTLSPLVAIGAAPSLSVIPGLATIGLNTLAGQGAAVGLSVVPGTATIGLNTLAAQAAPLALSVIPGSVTISLSTVAAIAAPIGLTVSPGGEVIIILATLAAIMAPVGLGDVLNWYARAAYTYTPPAQSVTVDKVNGSRVHYVKTDVRSWVKK